MNTTIKYYKETETGEPLAVFFNTLNKGIFDVYSPVDGLQRATYNYVVNLQPATKNEVNRMKKLLQVAGYIQP